MAAIEFMGMPKAGKSTQIEIVETVLKHEKRQRTQVIYEGARTCPFDKEYRFSYHSWSFHTMINCLLEAHQMPQDYILVDRGVYDHIAFSFALYKNGDLTSTQFAAQKTYFQEFQNLEEKIIIIQLHPETALKRATSDYGRVMNSEFLAVLADAYRETIPLVQQEHIIVDGSKRKEENAEEILEFLGWKRMPLRHAFL